MTQPDREYAKQIAAVIVEGKVRSLNPVHPSASTASKAGALASIAQALYLSGAEHEWLDPEIGVFITFVRARQLPDNNCGWELNDDMMRKYGGGIFNSCDEPSIRVDALQNWVNAAATYLEYQGMVKK